MEYTKLIKTNMRNVAGSVCYYTLSNLGVQDDVHIDAYMQSAWREIAGERAQNLRRCEILRSQCYYVLHSGF